MSDQLLAPDEVRIYLKEGLPYIMPRINLDNTLRLLQDKIQKVEYPKPPAPVIPVAAPIATVEKTKASLLGELFKDNKILAGELIDWIEKSESWEDIGIVLKGETRKTVKDAAKQRISELI
ncbi:MAG: hypothetical protein COA65_08690 [Rhodospirillaceae bacterium]|nr:MAG: hypothetical protein COA65_08690 [Rhodospirillaceae bacterium]